MFTKGKDGFYARYVKRILDVVLSVVAFILLSPLMAIIAIIIRFNMGTPVLFTQERIGKDEKPFIIKKFRTMTNKRDRAGLLPDVKRITSFGKFLRSTSLDELPTLYNIIVGDMSIVGPRPLPMVYLPYFSEWERKRHCIRGGLSGYAQINGRGILPWEKRFVYDNQYIDDISFWTDVVIVYKTIGKVLERSDIGLRGVTATEDFDVYRKKKGERT